MIRFTRVTSVLSALAVCSLLILGPMPGNANAFERRSSVTGAKGRTATQDVNAGRTATGYQRSSATTGPGGKSVDTQASGSWNSSTKTWSKDKSVTGPKGRSKSWQKSTTISK